MSHDAIQEACSCCDSRSGSSSSGGGADGFRHYAETLESLFPRSVPETIFIDKMSSILNGHGFTSNTAINLVSTCRDELCRPFVQHLDKTWGHSFNISSLAGMVFCGRTGFKAAMAHAPVVDGKEKYIFWVAPHIALPIHGETGTVYRPGRAAPSTACGALLAVLGEMKANKINMHLDPSDLEQSLLKQHVVSHLRYGHVPTLTELTYAAHSCIVEEVMRTAEASVDKSRCEFVVISGIQIHGALGQNFFWPGTMTKIANGTETDLYEEYAAEVAGWKLDGWVQGEALAELQDRERACRLAVEEGDVNKLLRAEVPLGQVLDHHRRSLLHIAAIHGQEAAAKCLVGKAALWPELLEMEDCFHRKALDYAMEYGHYNVAEVLVAMGCGLDGAYLMEAMIAAVGLCDVEAVKRLLRFARDGKEAISVKDSDGRGLVHIAASCDHVLKDAMIDLLFSYGTQITADFYGQVPRGSIELRRRSSHETSGASTPVKAAAELPMRRREAASLLEGVESGVRKAGRPRGEHRDNLKGESLADDGAPDRRFEQNPGHHRLPPTVPDGSEGGLSLRRDSDLAEAAAAERGVVWNLVRSILAALLALMGLKGRARIGATELLLGAAAIAAVIQRQRAGPRR